MNFAFSMANAMFESVLGAYFETIMVAVALLNGLVRPQSGAKVFERIEEFLSRVTANRTRCLWFAFALPIVVRICLLPLYPPPQAAIHDEYTHLVIADRDRLDAGDSAVLRVAAIRRGMAGDGGDERGNFLDVMRADAGNMGAP